MAIIAVGSRRSATLNGTNEGNVVVLDDIPLFSSQDEIISG